VSGFVGSRDCYSLFKLNRTIGEQKQEIKGLLKLEYLAHVSSFEDKCEFDVCQDDATIYHSAVKDVLRTKTKKPQKTLRIADSQGIPASSYYEERVIFKEHFTEVFHGEKVDFKQIVDEYRNDNKSRFENINPRHVNNSIRTTFELRNDFLAMRKKNACGEDLLVPELNKNHAKTISSFFFPAN
jgi:hypothetical protein